MVELHILDIQMEISKRITGIIYFKFEGFCFPEKEWNDDVPILLNWWIESLFKFTKNKRVKSKLLFMDGPFVVEIRRDFKEYWSFKFIEEQHHLERRHHIVLLHLTSINSIDFISSFQGKIEEFLKICDEKKWQSEELKKLKTNIIKLMKISSILKENR